MMYYQVLLLVCCIGLATGEDGCQYTSYSPIGSLNCTNVIPKNIPTRTDIYIEVYMYFTNTAIPSVAFSNDSGRFQGADNIYVLEIRCKDNDQTTLHVKSGGLSKFHNIISLSLECSNIILHEDAFDGLNILRHLTIYNEIPINIPTSTAELYLHLTNTSIPSVTFSNESGRLQGADNVSSIKIRCEDNNQTALHVTSGGLSNFRKLNTLSLECDNMILHEDAFDGLFNLRRLAIYNQIPINIPTNTNEFHMYFTNMSIPSVTFSNDSGRLQGAGNVTRLEIKCKSNNQTALRVKPGGFSNFQDLQFLYLECAKLIVDKDVFSGINNLNRFFINTTSNLFNNEFLPNLNVVINIRQIFLYENGYKCHYTTSLRTLTLRCNGIPLNILSGTTELYIDFTSTSMPSPMFRNDSQQLQGAGYVAKLSISCKDNNQTTLLLKSGGLSKFHNLRDLTLGCANIKLEKYAFYGLTNLERLSINDFVNLSNEELLSNLYPETLPNIRYLTLQNTGIKYDEGFDLNSRFWGTSLEVGFTEMNISKLVADFVWYHSSVKYNIQRSSISTLEFDLNDTMKGEPIRYLDKGENNTVTNMRMLCTYYGHWKYGYEIHVPFTLATVWNFENDCYGNYRTLMITNLNLRDGFQFNPGEVFNVTELSIRKCHLKNISNPLFAKNVNLTKLSLSSNNIGFIHPDTFKMSASLIHLDLSTNDLQNMNRNNGNSFKTLFSPLRKLQILSLQGNKITNISAKMFIDNPLLKSIDLSSNHILHLNFLTEGLDQLMYINLQNNSINHIDSSILDRLDLLCLKKEQENASSVSGIVLKENPLSCSSCIHNELISWTLKNRDCLPINSSTMCYDEDGILTNIFTKPLLVCITEIIGIAIAVSLIFLIATIVTCIIKRKRPGLKAHFGFPILGIPMNDVNAPPCKYFVFLAYSSQDEEFVNNKVKPELIEGLKARIKDDIEPVCIGDMKFRLGMRIHDEIITCIEQSKAVLVLLTDHYCRSDYCVTEFQRAIQLHKPVIVMVKDKVDQSLMTPEMKLHYKTNTRIIWKWENGDYVLKSSWKNVCDSLINLDRRA